MTTIKASLSDKTIQRALLEFGVTVSAEQVLSIQQYIKILLLWNEKIGLTAIRDPLEILYRHFCESIFAAVAVPVENGRLADVGSGAGFPGLALKVFRPELQVLLVESNVKKATFLAEVIRELGLSGARVVVRRYEELGEEVAPLDYACSRALGEFASFLSWAAAPQVAASKVVLWVGGRDLDEVRSVPIWAWQEPIPIPKSLRRYILVGVRKSVDEVGVTT